MKYKFLIIFLTFLIFSFFTNISFAQEYKKIPTFEMSFPEQSLRITKSQVESSDIPISLLPITTIMVKKGSFSEDVNVSVYKGKWELLTLGDNKDNSPISAYYIAFLDSNGSELVPSKPVELFIYNNYIGTDATFIPLSKDYGVPDTKNKLVFSDHTTVRALLNANDAGFVVYINKKLDKNDASLSSITVSPGATAATPTTFKTKSFLSQNILLISVLAVLVIAILGIIITLSWKGSKKPNTQ